MTTSILAKLKNLRTTSGKEAEVPMTEQQIAQCKAALKRDSRGPAVQVNKFDLNTPYRVTVNFDDKWTNHGLFTSADVAAAVGTIVSASVFGDKAIAGLYDEAVVEAHEEFQNWLADSRNADILVRVAQGTCLLDNKAAATEEESGNVF